MAAEAVQILAAASAPGAALLGGVAAGIAQGTTRYYLAAGTGEFYRPLWAFAAGSEPVPSVAAMAEQILHRREERERLLERELRAIDEWLAAPGGTAKTLLVEVFGPAERDLVGFLRAARRRGPEGGSARLVVLRHPAPAGELPPPEAETDEILLCLALSGGYAPATLLAQWAARCGWRPHQVRRVSAARASSEGTLRTYASAGHWARAAGLTTRAAPELVRELASLVTRDAPRPLLATAVRLADPGQALASYSRLGCAELTTPGPLARYCRALLRRARDTRWSAVAKPTAYALYLASLVGGRARVSASAADRMLELARRGGVEAEVRSLLAYELGQRLAKGGAAEARTAGMRCFAYARDCVRGPHDAPRSAAASRVAASYNGEALVRYRCGDHAGAVRAELAGLAALATPGLRTRQLAEQRVLLLTNLAEVYGRAEATQPQALRCGREAWRVATGVGSLVGLTYAVPSLVRRLLAADRYAEAAQVTGELLRHYDRESASRLAAERAVVSTCCRLAEAGLAAGAVARAARWYGEAASRMRLASPDAIGGIIQNLRGCDPTVTQPVIASLEATLAAHRAVAADLAALSTLVNVGDGRD